MYKDGNIYVSDLSITHAYFLQNFPWTHTMQVRMPLGFPERLVSSWYKSCENARNIPESRGKEKAQCLLHTYKELGLTHHVHV